jgi:hypothetical protein
LRESSSATSKKLQSTKYIENNSEEELHLNTILALVLECCDGCDGDMLGLIGPTRVGAEKLKKIPPPNSDPRSPQLPTAQLRL